MKIKDQKREHVHGREEASRRSIEREMSGTAIMSLTKAYYEVEDPLCESGIYSSSGRETVSPSRENSLMEILTDVTDCKRNEGRLGAGQKLLQAIFDNTRDGILLADSEGRHVDANPAVCTLLGYSREELCQKNCWDILPVSDLETGFAWWEHFISTGRLGGEFVILTKNGIKLQVHYRAIANVVPGVHLSVLRDMSDRRRLEKELLGVSERERRRIGQDLHDELGQQLTAISFLTKALEQKLSARKLAAAEDSKRIVNLLNETIAITRSLSKGLILVSPAPQGLAYALGELADSVTETSGTRCTFEYPRAVSIHSIDAATQLYRIAQEAVTNAVKHSGAQCVRIELANGQGGVVLTVEDDGAGFTPSKTKGGMGLFIMRHRSQLINATLNIGPRSNGGTVLTVSSRTNA